MSKTARAAESGATLPGRDSACSTRQPSGGWASAARPPGREARSMMRHGGVSSASTGAVSTGAGTVLKIRSKPARCPPRERVSSAGSPAAAIRAKSRAHRAETEVSAPRACSFPASSIPMRPAPMTRHRAPCKVNAVCSIASWSAPSQVGNALAVLHIRAGAAA